MNGIQQTIQTKDHKSKISNHTRRSGIEIMTKLITLIDPLKAIILITISMGILGFLVAIFITVLGAVGISVIIDRAFLPIDLNLTIYLLISFAIARGILRYLEQYSGHFIAFKILALLRDKVYKALRRLCPTKLDKKTSGKLISVITADVEQLEVFYAHTIAPIIIGILTSLIMVGIIYTLSPILAIIALVSYFIVGFVIPYTTSKNFREYGRIYREDVGDINTAFLENLYGMREIISFNNMSQRQMLLDRLSSKAHIIVKKLKEHQGKTKALSETAILISSMIMLFTGIFLVHNELLSFEAFLVAIVCLMSSYGPTIALSNLSNNLLQTFASGERVLDLLEEPVEIEEKMNGVDIIDYDIQIKNIDFSYDKEKILDHISLDIKKNQIIGIIGKSGIGKSTLLKLLMRFYDVDGGEILFGNQSIKDINTNSLRNNISYVTQDTFLFNRTIEENLRVAKRHATMEEIIDACKKASIHEFIMTLPDQYQSQVGELGDMLSGGEQQRLGLARAFLHNSKIVLLDEPTSNLDSLNESIILNSLKNHSKDKTIILVSHRKSTLSICDTVYYFEQGRLS